MRERIPSRIPSGLVLAGLLLAALACGDSHSHNGQGGARPGAYEGLGVVVSVDEELGQVLLDHEDIPDLMPAMTMNFDVPDPKVMSKLKAGQRISFRVQFTGSAYRVVSAEVVGEGGGRGSRLGIEDALPADMPAPGFTLVDQDGEAVSLEDFRGRAVLLDFVYTRCQGPCPILTALHAQVQAGISPDDREDIQLVSVTIDPAHDDPAILREYAKGVGADLGSWSFLTGEVEAVKSVLGSYGVGLGATTGDQIEHMVMSFLIDGEGIVVKRYIGTDHPADEIRDDLVRVARAAS